jgi:regulatory protein
MQSADETRISAIEPQQRAKDRVNVYLNGEFALGLNSGVVVSLGLSVGQSISESRLKEIARAESLNKAVERACLLLSYRARTEKEIRDRLQRAGFDEDIIEETLVKLYALNYLNDEDFAEKLIQARRAERPMGRRAMGWELRRKGISPETVDASLAEVDEDWEAAAALDAAKSRVVWSTPKHAANWRLSCKGEGLRGIL